MEIREDNDIKVKIKPLVYSAIRNYPSSLSYPLEFLNKDEKDVTVAEKIVYAGSKIEDMILSLARLFDITRMELAWYFTKEEVFFFLRTLENLLFQVVEGLNPREMIELWIDGVLEYRYDTLTDEDFKVAKTLRDKVRKLSAFQAYVMIVLGLDFIRKRDNFTMDDIRKTFMAV